MGGLSLVMELAAGETSGLADGRNGEVTTDISMAILYSSSLWWKLVVSLKDNFLLNELNRH